MVIDVNDEPTKKVFFIASASFSGSTMLDMILSNHPKGFSLGEISALFRPYRPHHFNAECGCQSPDCTIWRDVAKQSEGNVYKALFDMFPEIDFVVDSSKDPFWIEAQSRFALQQGFEVIHLLLWKEPAAFAHSMLKRRQEVKWHKHWTRYYRRYASIYSKLPPSIKFKAMPYEELVSNPDACVERICALAGIQKAENQEQFWNKEHHTLFGNDSAKVHLSEVEDQQPDSANFGDSEDNSKHRKIYYDSPLESELSARTRRILKVDKEVALIKCALKSANSEPSLLAAIKWPKLHLSVFLTAYKVRCIAGLLFGRWFRTS